MSTQATQMQMAQSTATSNAQYMQMLQSALVNSQSTAQTGLQNSAYCVPQTVSANNTATFVVTASTTAGTHYPSPLQNTVPPASHAPYYSGARLDFNKYLNASDLLEEFIDDVQALGGITKEEFLKLPVESFIRWLVIKAAEADEEPPKPDTSWQAMLPVNSPPLALPISKRPRCEYCGRFNTYNRDAHGFNFCNGDHYDKYEAKIKRACSGG